MSKIEWTDETWNPVTGCEKVSPGCDHCYAATWAARRMGEWKGLEFGDVRCYPARLEIPLRRRKPTRYFVNSMSDLFHKDVPDQFIADVFHTMWIAKGHTFQVLTKRPERMRRLVPRIWSAEFRAQPADQPCFLPENIWLGVSIESADYAWRADMLRETPAAVRFLSLEPLLGHIPAIVLNDMDWVIVGGESGSGARPIDPQWVRDIRDDCQAMGIPFFFKQLGGVRDKRGGDAALLDGRRYLEFPR